MSRYNDIFDTNGNLTMDARILYAYAMHLSKVGELPPALIEHFWNNEESREEIIELYELYDAETIAAHPHPFFLHSKTKPSIVSIDWENLDTALENLLRTALAEQSQPNRSMERKMAASFKATASNFSVSEPRKDAVCVESIRFVFPQLVSQSAALHVKNAKGKTIGRYEVPKDSKTFKISIADSQQFPSGLYYWTLLVGSMPITNRLYICTKEDGRRILDSE